MRCIFIRKYFNIRDTFIRECNKKIVTKNFARFMILFISVGTFYYHYERTENCYCCCCAIIYER